ncbi:flavodoxin domain-containing protein [Kitasatospora aureofaciens]|uniref:flavodoxin family protein n=1 Tax=Kitasatospora aureofaciens TaxID=1894 RepID=UPI0033ED4070
MHTVIVYESMYGNTREVAEAIADGVHRTDPSGTIDCLALNEAGSDVTRTADLLVVGGPTHMHGMSSGLSRHLAAYTESRKEGHEAAAKEARETAESQGLRSWFQDLPRTEPGTYAAAFDTRVDTPRAGGAARGIASRLSGHSYDLVAEPEGFIVEGTDGPLRAGELDRARDWGAQLV